jgi:predicted PurR-regulated permease PerM
MPAHRDQHDHPPHAAPRVSPDAVAIHRAHEPRTVLPHHLYQAAGLLFLLALVFRFFDQLGRVFLLAYFAAILAVGLNALLQKLPLQRKLFAAGVGLLVVGAVVAALYFGMPVLFEQARSMARMGPGLQEQVKEWEGWIRQNFGLNVRLPSLMGGGAEQSAAGQGGQGAMGRAFGLIEALFIPIVVFFGSLFLLANPNQRLLTPLMRVVPSGLRPAFYRIFQLLGERLVGWLKGTAIAMVAVGTLSVIAFSLIGVPNALLLGLFNGLVEFIPLVGPFVGGGTATLVAFVADPTKALWTAVAATAIQQVEANVITPFAMSRAAEVHPFITLFALLLFGEIFGFLGLLLALPLVLLVWTVVQVLWVERALDTDRDRIAPVVEE